MMFKSAKEKAKFYRDRKKSKQREYTLNCYHKNKDRYNQTKKNERNNKHITSNAIKNTARGVREFRQKMKIKQMNNRLYQATYRQRKKLNVQPTDIYTFGNRMQKTRLLQKIKDVVSGTPITQKKMLTAVVNNTKISPNEFIDTNIVTNIKEMITSVKHKRSDDARATMNILTASLSGENLTETKTKCTVARQLGLRRWRVIGGYKKRTTFLTSEKACYTETSRWTRRDRISENVKKQVYEWWTSAKASRPTGNKADIKKLRTGYKTYLKHPLYVMEKSQSEIYQEFKIENSDIQISQRTFEKLRPFYVQQIRPKDRHTCCCRKHVEARLVFRRCMDFNRKQGKHELTFEHLMDVLYSTMCTRLNDHPYNNLECIKRTCGQCGIDKLPLFAPENIPESSQDIIWERYEYRNIDVKGGGQRRKLMLVKKSTSPADMFTYFKALLQDFALHQFSASWQLKQLETLKACLPFNTCLAIHDFSENYRCIEKEELQSSYFGKTEVSIHVTVLYRHAVLEYDEMDESNIVTELLFCISPDQSHDHYFVTSVQKEVHQYLQSIRLPIKTMIEFTDGCAAQYKSRNCLGVSTNLCKDMGYDTFIRNFFETSHAKGPQDAAGGMLKRQIDLAVMKGEVIQNARDVFDYASVNLSTPKSGIYTRRLYRYIDAIDRSNQYNYNAVPNIRSIHQFSTYGSREIEVRQQSCYTCDNCIIGTMLPCDNINITGSLRVVTMANGNNPSGSDDCEDDFSIDQMINIGSVVAVVADDESDDYFLLQVTKVPYTLTRTSCDAWGNSFPEGSRVLNGLYYDRIPGHLHRYRIIKKKKAIIFLATVCYIVDKEAMSTIELNEDEHLDIIYTIPETM